MNLGPNGLKAFLAIWYGLIAGLCVVGFNVGAGFAVYCVGCLGATPWCLVAVAPAAAMNIIMMLNASKQTGVEESNAAEIIHAVGGVAAGISKMFRFDKSGKKKSPRDHDRKRAVDELVEGYAAHPAAHDHGRVLASRGSYRRPAARTTPERSTTWTQAGVQTAHQSVRHARQSTGAMGPPARYEGPVRRTTDRNYEYRDGDDYDDN